MLYGIENIGISDSALHTVRITASAANSTDTAGKSPDVCLALTDGACGTADPAFEAHSNPLKYWSLAFWENWFCHDALLTTLRLARKRSQQHKPTEWNWVRGPVTALLATLTRLKWN